MSRWYPVREVVDFWEGSIGEYRGGGGVGYEGLGRLLGRPGGRGGGQILWRAVGPFPPLANNSNSQPTDVHSLPATTTLPASSATLEILYDFDLFGSHAVTPRNGFELVHGFSYEF